MIHDSQDSLQSRLDDGGWAFIARRLGLSAREAQIVGRILADDKETDIARALGMSPHTVRTHVERAYRKLRVRTRAQLIMRIVGCLLAEIDRPGSRFTPLCGVRAVGRCPLFRAEASGSGPLFGSS